MGKSKEQPLKINVKTLNKNAKMECMNELQAFFSCMAVGYHLSARISIVVEAAGHPTCNHFWVLICRGVVSTSMETAMARGRRCQIAHQLR